jgi:excinuclease UvrABC helicase subunit UvrB
VHTGLQIPRNTMLRQLVDAMYSRAEVEFQRGNFRVKGDTVDIFPAYADIAIRIVFWGEEVEEISSFDPCFRTHTENGRSRDLSGQYFCNYQRAAE